MKEESYEQIKELLKSEWIDDISSISDVTVLKEQSGYYISILENLDKLELRKSEESIKEKSEVVLEEREQSDIYTLKRALFGGYGYKESSTEEVFVPEQVIRNEGLEHGDKFKYIKDGIVQGRDYFKKSYEEPKDISLEPNNILSYEYAYVEFDDALNQHVIKSYLENGEKQFTATCLIHYDDILKFKLKEGDVVSVARNQNKSIFRVRWKYNSDDILPMVTAKKPTFYKNKDDFSKNTEEDNSFEGLNVGVVGTDTFINKYVEEVESRGGYIHHTNSDIKSYITQIVNNSDVIVIPIKQTSHAKAEAAKEAAKRSDKPFVILNTNGRTNFVNQIKEAMNIQ